jgi:hypothetical protein
MLTVYVTDLNVTKKIDVGQGKQSIAYVMTLKKVFFSVVELLEPVIPENNDVSKITWIATQADLRSFQKLVKHWQNLELRLRAYTAFAGMGAMDIIVQVAKKNRLARLHEQNTVEANMVELDVLMLANIHQQLDQLLAKEPPYTGSFLQDWPEFKNSKSFGGLI